MKLKKMLVSFLSLIAIGSTVSFAYLYNKVISINNDVATIKDELGENDAQEKEVDLLKGVVVSKNIINILAVGSDSRSYDDVGRADSIMIVTIDEKHKKVKLTSIARDTYVDIPRYGKEKINHAYAYGGVDLLIETIESNLGIEISEYIQVNFNSFIEIIDVLGGIKLDVHESELEELNKFIPECYEAQVNPSGEIELIEKPGEQILNGYQALSYARIRKNDDAFQRDNRQRLMMQELLNKLKGISILDVPKVLESIIPYVDSSLPNTEIANLGLKTLKMGVSEISQSSFPALEYSEGGILGSKGWVLQYDKEKVLPILHDFIFEE